VTKNFHFKKVEQNGFGFGSTFSTSLRKVEGFGSTFSTSLRKVEKRLVPFNSLII